MARIALYPGSFDPLTNGHVEIIRAACRLCDTLIVGLGVHASKLAASPVEDRLRNIQAVAGPIARELGVSLEAGTFDGLVVDFARTSGATLLIRGLRDGSDLDYEMQMAGMNAALAPTVQTVFLPASSATRHITATLVRQVAAMGGDVSPFVPAAVAGQLSAGRQT